MSSRIATQSAAGSPELRDGFPAEHFGNALARGAAGVCRQGFGREEPCATVLWVRRGRGSWRDRGQGESAAVSRRPTPPME